ncbi:hypothetical protein [Planococcus sp. CPCC 101016]|uniref:hypothetical protein n=1 Tax=Planococcus sp. CPCC 101016 TaxID=2599617 RepID=UPI0021BD265D|nr:hypothetical protein [Planococcus sp. CPCC 101016]
MKRKAGLAILALILMASGIFYYTTFFSYQASEAFSGFPIPKKAELLEENQDARIYNWKKASEENGIPLGYELVLKLNGWDKQEREGASVSYTKGEKHIDVISQVQLLTLRKME